MKFGFQNNHLVGPMLYSYSNRNKGYNVGKVRNTDKNI